jgi:hypothetical protein
MISPEQQLMDLHKQEPLNTCRCHCHKPGPHQARIKHEEPCCERCPKCKLRIRSHSLNKHLETCVPISELPDRVIY